MVKAPKGTYDVLPNISHAWQKIEAVEREVAGLAGYREIRTPVFEHTELFLRGVGDTTDIVQKEMYTFKDKGDRSITLKPEGTAGVVRAMLEAGLNQGVMPLKVYYLSTPIFRYEAPQSGRMREHHQFGVEVFGAQQPTVDAEVISIPLDVMKKLGLTDYSLNINSIGCPKCRPHYHEKLREFLTERKDKLCPTCNDRLARNPLRILDCKSPECQAAIEGAPVMLDYLCDECADHWAGLKKALDAIGISYTINPRIVRGLDYYTKTVFEIIINTDEGKLTACGGGRYDELVRELGGQATPGIGFGMGIERLLMLLERQNKTPEAESLSDVFLATLSADSRLDAIRYVSELRLLGIKADMDHVGRSLKAQFKFADKIGAKFVLILGGDEAAQGEAVLRNLALHSEERVPLDGLAKAVAVKFENN
jgi:histidyl-tRNA synthetase